MADFYIKQGDRLPAFQATLVDGNNQPVNLTGATVTYSMKNSAGTLTVNNGACTIVSATGGIVSYPWASGDTNTPDTYTAEFEVTFGSGLVARFPNGANLQVVITAKVN